MRPRYLGIFMIFLQIFPSPLFCQSLIYSGKEITGQIVDADTERPLRGVVIVAQWILYETGIGSGGHKKRLHIAETVSDEKGLYTIPPWGPKLRPPFFELDTYDPQLSLFKSGYRPLLLYNARAGLGSLRASDWNRKTIKLKTFVGTTAERFSQLEDALANSGAGQGTAPNSIFLEILKEETAFRDWPAGAHAFFSHVRDLSHKKADQ